MYAIGIDIGSTATKVIALDAAKKQILHSLLMPTGWNSKETAAAVLESLGEWGISPENAFITATGYGRVSVPYAHKVITEITCHGRGAVFLNQGKDCTVIDIGGQDTKIITMKNGMVEDFIMNDKCSAGTGRFLEIMANTLGVHIELIAISSPWGEPCGNIRACSPRRRNCY